MLRLSICGLTALICLTVPLLSRAQDIITTAAGATWTFPGDGGAATDAPLGEVQAVAIDAAGDVFAADTGNNLVVKISSTGILTVVAGNGIRGFSGDGGPATSASLNQPSSVAVDTAGNLYIVDKDNQRIRKVTPGGTITTVAGNGDFGFTGDGGPATSASLNFPRGVAVDADGNLYIADTYSNRIRKVTPGGTITTVAGSGSADPGAGGFSGDGGPATSASLNFPTSAALDALGNLYIADLGNHRVRKVTPGGTITTVAGSGPPGAFSGDGGSATSASLNLPSGVAVDAAGNLFIADLINERVRKVDAIGIITTVAGNGSFGFSGDGGQATDAELARPADVAVDAAGDLYIADTDNQRVRKVTSGGIITTVAGNGNIGFSGDGGPAISAELHLSSGAGGVAVDADNNLYIADTNNGRIRKVTPGGTISTVAGSDAPCCELDVSLAHDMSGLINM